MFKRNFKEQIKTAISWGIPSDECYGYSASEFTALLSLCLKRINYLEDTLRENKVQFTETDWTEAKVQELIKDL